MNEWTRKSAELAQTKDYLDRLYEVYKITPNPEREIPQNVLDKIKYYIESENNDIELLKLLFTLELFPIKDSYVAFLKKEKNALKNNPRQVKRICDLIREMGYDKVVSRITEPKETNRQIGPMFKAWVEKARLGLNIYDHPYIFADTMADGILNCSDAAMRIFAQEYLGYNRNKGLDFIARKNGIYIIGEAKFLSDFGGHQNAQFDDALSTMHSPINSGAKVIPICILDGVNYIEGNNKFYKYLKENDDIIISALLLKDFLESIK